MDLEKIITRAQRRVDIQTANLAATREEIKTLTGVPLMTRALANLQVKHDRQAAALNSTTQLVEYYTKRLATQQGKIK